MTSAEHGPTDTLFKVALSLSPKVPRRPSGDLPDRAMLLTPPSGDLHFPGAVRSHRRARHAQELIIPDETQLPSRQFTSPRMDFIRGAPPPRKPPTHLPALETGVSMLLGKSSSSSPTQGASPTDGTSLLVETTPSAPSTMASAPTTMDECMLEIEKLRAELKAERAELKHERRRRVACETELQLVQRELKGSKGSALCAAAAENDVDKLLELAQADDDVDSGDYDRRTPLHVAAADGHLAAVTCLVNSCGAKLSPVDRWGNTPLDDAVEQRHNDVAHYLKSKGAAHSPGFTARIGSQFRTAANAGNVDSLRALAPHADVNAANYEQRTPLHLAASSGSAEAVRCLLELGVQVSPVDRWGNTPLDAALRKAHTEIISIIKDKGGVVGSADADGFAARNAAAFRTAAAAGDVEKLKQLAPQIADVNAANYEQRTPLHLAAASGNSLAAVNLLIELGATVSPLDAAGNTPLDEAIRVGHSEVAASLEKRGGYRGASFRQMKRASTRRRPSAGGGRDDQAPSSRGALPSRSASMRPPLRPLCARASSPSARSSMSSSRASSNQVPRPSRRAHAAHARRRRLPAASARRSSATIHATAPSLTTRAAPWASATRTARAPSTLSPAMTPSPSFVSSMGTGATATVSPSRRSSRCTSSSIARRPT